MLIAIAIGGSALVLDAGLSYLRSLSGPSVSLVAASIRQGVTASVESVTVSNDGTVPLGSFVISTSEPPSGGTYCTYVRDPTTGDVLTETCPSQTPFTGTLAVTGQVPPGSAVQVEVVIEGGSFSVGTLHVVSVTAADGAQASDKVQVAPA